MNPTSLAHLPQRLRESSFRRFETVISKAVRAFPAVVNFNPADLGYTALTFVDRLRGAMQSLHIYKWPTTVVDMEKFERVYNEIIVSHRETMVTLGSRSYLAPAAEPANLNVDPITEVRMEVIPLATAAEKSLLCRLASDRLLRCALRVSGISVSEANTLEQDYDVRIDVGVDGISTVL